MSEFRYGWKPSLRDIRNIPADLEGMKIADKVDPRDKMQEPYDQGELGSCTANAYAGAVEYDDILNGGTFGTPSRLAIYYEERELEGTVNSDSGAQGHNAFKCGRKSGVASESLWPYDISKFAEMPPNSYDVQRAKHKVGDYRHPAQTEPALKRVLSHSQTIAFGFTVYASFESEETLRTGVVPMPRKGERVLGGHEVLIVGYVKEGYFLVRNSWGTSTGEGGYLHFPIPYVINPQLSGDMRTVYRPAGA